MKRSGSWSCDAPPPAGAANASGSGRPSLAGTVNAFARGRPRRPASGRRRACGAGSAGNLRLPGKRQGRRCGAARGLTLLEMLVVLVLVSLLGTVVIQGVGFFLGKYATVKRIHRETSLATLRQHWFVSTVQAMVPSPLEARRFAGDASSFEGVTMQPLAAESGVSVRVRWTIGDGGASSVVYAEEGRAAWTVLASGREEDLAFQYADSAGQWHDHWPIVVDPRRPPLERIPRMVRLISAAGRTVWLAHLDLSPEPVHNFLEDDL